MFSVFRRNPLKQQERLQEKSRSYAIKAMKYAHRMQNAYGFFCYKDYIATISNSSIYYDTLGTKLWIGDIGDEIIFNTKEEYKSFISDVDCTPNMYNYLKTRNEVFFFNLLKHHGKSILFDDRDAEGYTIEKDNNNFISGVHEPDGHYWFRYGHGTSWCSSSSPFDYNQDNGSRYYIMVLNHIRSNKK